MFSRRGFNWWTLYHAICCLVVWCVFWCRILFISEVGLQSSIQAERTHVEYMIHTALTDIKQTLSLWDDRETATTKRHATDISDMVWFTRLVNLRDIFLVYLHRIILTSFVDQKSRLSGAVQQIQLAFDTLASGLAGQLTQHTDAFQVCQDPCLLVDPFFIFFAKSDEYVFFFCPVTQ